MRGLDCGVTLVLLKRAALERITDKDRLRGVLAYAHICNRASENAEGTAFRHAGRTESRVRSIGLVLHYMRTFVATAKCTPPSAEYLGMQVVNEVQEGASQRRLPRPATGWR